MFLTLMLLASPTAVEADLTSERALAARVLDLRARDNVRKLVEFGPRMGGTPSGQKAADWLEEQFEEMGLKAHQRTDPEKRCHWEESWSLSVRIEDEEPFPIERSWPWGFSPSAKGKATLSTDPVEGQAWLSDQRARPRRSDPAPAVILVDGANTSDGEWPVCRPNGYGERAPVFGIPAASGARIREALEADKSVALSYELVAKIEKRSPKTVVAVLPARKRAAKGHLCICAHGDSDSGGPGANDNASGEAILLEIARAWKEAIDAGELAAPAMEVRFVVWGSEIHSTRAYLEEFAEHKKNPVLAVLNYDQAGFGSELEQLNVEPDDLPANQEFVRLAASVLTDHVGAEGFPKEWATNKSLGGTDSYVFSGSKTFRQEMRPAVTLFTSAWDSPETHPRTKDMPGQQGTDAAEVKVDYDLYYHSMGDTPENTTDKEPHNMGWCARVGLLLALRWLDR